MRRLVAVGIVVLLAVALTGCGGGDGSSAASEGDAIQTSSPTADSTASPGEVVSTDASDTLSPQVEQVFEPFPTDETVVPSEIADRLESHQPMVILFYDGSQSTADDQREAVDTVMEDYRGLIDLVAYDVGSYVDTNEDGTISIDPSLADDADAKKVADLFGDGYLDVRFTPYIVLVDSQGYITHRFQGFVDEKTLEREVLRATE